MDLLDRLLDHDRWATIQLLELSRNLSDERLDQSFDIGHQTLRETFGHMIFNLAFWTGLMAGAPIDSDRIIQHPDRSMAVLIDWHERSDETFSDLARQMRDEQRLDDTFVDHFDGPMTFGGAILHVILHNAEHRSEALHILQRLGMPDLPEIDHGLWDYKRRGF